MGILIHLYFGNVVSVEGVECFVGSVKGRQGLVQNSVSFLFFLQSLFGLFQDDLFLVLNNHLNIACLQSVHFKLFE